MTTPPIPPTTWAPLETALRQRQTVEVTYHGRRRLISPHALGWKNGRPMLLGYQTGGQTTTGTLPVDPTKRWRCLYIDEIDHITADPTSQWQTAHNYNHAQPFPNIDHVTIAITPDGQAT